MTLLPTLSRQIMAEMDVESLTRELQTKSKAKTGRFTGALSEASLASSVEIPHGDAQSEMGSVTSGMSFISSGSELADKEGSTSQLPTVTQSWVEDFSAQASSSHGPSLTLPSESPRSRESSTASGANLSDSIVSESIASTSDAEYIRAVRGFVLLVDTNI